MIQKVSITELRERQGLSLIQKMKWAAERYIDFIEPSDGRPCYLGFSGGKDSQTLKHFIEKLHLGEFEFLFEPKSDYHFLYLRLIKFKPAPPSVFCNTGLEFDLIRQHVKTFKDTIWLTPAEKWTSVVKNHGFLIGGKKTSRQLHDIRTPTNKNQTTRTLYLTGINSKGIFSKDWKLAAKWRPLIEAPFKISGKCCDIFKKDPFHKYEKETNRLPITATMVEESDMRRISYLKTGCNSFEGGAEMCRPFSIWLESDIWEYSKKYNIRFSEIYYDREMAIEGLDFIINISGEKRTGCTICLVGDKKMIVERFKRLKQIEPKKYNFYVNDPKINMRQIFEYMGIMDEIEPPQQTIF